MGKDVPSAAPGPTDKTALYVKAVKGRMKIGKPQKRGTVVMLPALESAFKKEYERHSTPQGARLLVRDRNGVTKLGPTDNQVITIYPKKRSRRQYQALVRVSKCKKIINFAGQAVANITTDKGLVTVDLK